MLKCMSAATVCPPNMCSTQLGLLRCDRFQAYVDVLEALRWTKFHVFYEDNDSLVRLQKVLKMMNTNNKISMTIRQLPTDKDYK